MAVLCHTTGDHCHTMGDPGRPTVILRHTMVIPFRTIVIHFHTMIILFRTFTVSFQYRKSVTGRWRTSAIQ
ncbi:MAG: hypothetical protein ABI855_11140 [Bacteroidota bacterium]